MDGRFAAMIEETAGKALDGAIQVAENHTVQASLPDPDVTRTPAMADYPVAITNAYHDPGYASEYPISIGSCALETMATDDKAVLACSRGSG